MLLQSPARLRGPCVHMKLLLISTDGFIAEKHPLGYFLVGSALGKKLQYHQFSIIDALEQVQLYTAWIIRAYRIQRLAGEIVIAGQYRFDRADKFAEVFLFANVTGGTGLHASDTEERRRLCREHQCLERRGHGVEA